MIKIEPVDTLFFRDGKPFSMGDQNTAFGIFPPYPSTVFGAMRTGIIAQNQGLGHFLGGNMSAEIGTVDDCSSASFKLKGAFLFNSADDYLFFPAPLDLVTEDEEKAIKTQIHESPPFSGNLDHRSYLFATELEKAKSVKGFYLLHTDFQGYLNGHGNEFDIYHEKLFCQIEYKTGIKLDSQSKTAEEGNLYRVGMHRLRKDITIACHFEGAPSLRKKGILKLGGEGKVVHYEKISFQFPDNRAAIIDRIKKTGIFKLYFATPALFQNGWLPGEEIINGPDYRLELVTASVGSPLSVGGWDMGKNQGKGGHKPMMRAIPAGSVYYFRIQDGTPESIIDTLNFRNLGQRSSEGFGMALVGGV